MKKDKGRKKIIFEDVKDQEEILREMHEKLRIDMDKELQRTA